MTMGNLGYVGAHARVYRKRGRASLHICSCGKQAAEWAYTYTAPCPDEQVSALGQKYSGDINRYVAMCHHCHRIYDKEAIVDCPKGHRYEGRNILMDAGKRKCRTCVYARNRLRKPNAEQQKRRIELQRIRRAKARGSSGST